MSADVARTANRARGRGRDTDLLFIGQGVVRVAGRGSRRRVLAEGPGRGSRQRVQAEGPGRGSRQRVLAEGHRTATSVRAVLAVNSSRRTLTARVQVPAVGMLIPYAT